MNLVQRFDRMIDGITMYRLMVYGLSILAVLSVIFAFAGPLSLSGTGLLLSFAISLISCGITNTLIGRFWPGVTNLESFVITALILGFIMPPPTSLSGAVAIALAGVVAISSKFLIAVNRKHLFNPAAFAAVVLGIAGLIYATWWIGSPIMLPFTALFGLVVLRKLRRFSLFWAFLVLSLVTTSIVTLTQHSPIPEALKLAFTSSPLLFLGTVMLTEPRTTPPRRNQQLAYGGIVGLIFSLQLSFGRISTTPELALILGNLFAYAVSPKHAFELTLKKINQLSPRIYDVVFSSPQKLQFAAGQYMEWTLPVPGFDSRGNRRTFSIASAPDESEVHIGIKTPDQLRGFKQALLHMQTGDTIMAGQLGGDFVLPKDQSQKLAFIAGGIGITPFRSMLQQAVLQKEHRDIVLFYMVADPEEISYKDVLQAAQKQGVKVVPVLSVAKGQTAPVSWQHPTGYLTKQLLTEHCPDFADRRFYLSGPPPMVRSYKSLLRTEGVAKSAIVTDYFAGY